MIRFVLGPDRLLVPDLAARLPGRGMWLSASSDLLQIGGHDVAAARNLTRAFARAARGSVSLPADLSALLQTGLVRRIGDFLGLARRAGQAVAGFDKAREMLQAGRARLVVHATDGSVAERARFLSGLGAGLDIIDPLPREALGRVFGRDYVVHVAVAPGKLAGSLIHDSGRLAGLRQPQAKQDGPRRPTGSARAAEQEIAPVNEKIWVPTDKA